MSETRAIVEHLREITGRQRLVDRTIDAMAGYVREAEPEEVDWVFAFEDIRPEFASHMLCFESMPPSVQAPYVSTHLELYVRTYRVGYFAFLTDIEGQKVSTRMWIEGGYYRGERAAALLQRALAREEGDPEEYMGLVGLRPPPGNDVFPDWARGGYVNVLALATNQDEFRQQVTAYWRALGVDVEEITDVEPLREQVVLADLDDEYLGLALSLTASIPVVHQAEIHSYESDDDDEEGGRGRTCRRG